MSSIPYQPELFYDELFFPSGQPRPEAAPLVEWIARLPTAELRQHQNTAQAALFNLGVTFRVYGDDEEGLERALPFDIIPRVISAQDWRALEGGLKQRVAALNCFLGDIYG
ncbi:MAG: circularly permuted type 2 ATP-grasp protein, partial [Cyanobacteriota bacterium]|nr:circularly permuted type 2 ATP-grasp protein [Cyanobacteriota bacterium]